ncbi:hypothetical protein CBR_g40045 [Chara braunii]|uniref:Phosphate transporter n=1 Tax=Chara braunii TaxID=69332 RepID=A0A388LT40_CHABU|nr:hypothetical protein CBR_g40045 [Chara braunii]|eukprot:GBG85403.1 hypothetical protein CBR_g40045 [Chara braunii]
MGNAEFELDGEYHWKFIAGIFAAFFMALGIGANDIANSFASAVGSEALTLKQAVLISWIFEFAGAFFMGDRVVDTIREGIIDPELYLLRSPTEYDRHGASLLMWGMFASLVMASSWIAFATYHGMPISTTHSLLCSIIGFSLVVKGWDSVHWYGGDKESKIGGGGFTAIVVSWVLTPLMAGVLSAGFYSLTKRLLLCPENSVQRTLLALPVYYGVTAFVVTFFIVYNGSGRLSLKNQGNGTATWIATSIGIAVALLARLVGVPMARRRLEIVVDANSQTTPVLSVFSKGASKSNGVTAEAMAVSVDRGAPPFDGGASAAGTASEAGVTPCHAAERAPTWGRPVVPFNESCAGEVGQAGEGRTWEWIENWYSTVEAKTIAHDLEFTERTRNIHKNAEVLDEQAEELFSFLQILTACASSFAHGSNDTANAIGPLSAIFNLYRGDAVHRRKDNPMHLEVSEVKVESWMLAMGGAALGLGFALWGWRMVRSLGGGVTKMTPSRGFTAVLCAALTVTLASGLAMPVSTTHTLVGSTVGVGSTDGWGNVDRKLLGKFFIAWVMTVFVAGVCTMGFVALTVFSPNIKA